MTVLNFYLRCCRFFRFQFVALMGSAVFLTMGLSLSSAQDADGALSEEALEAKSGRVSGGPLFEELDPHSTGMADFSNDYGSPRIWGEHWRTYLFGAIGTGIAIGDVDGDGLPDIFAVSKNERSRLYRNLGDFKFEDITENSGIDDGDTSIIDKNETPGGGAAFADVNNDGHIDLYLCFLGAPNQLWINDGTGRFVERAAQWGVDVDTASVMGYFADYDGDGLLDLYLATNLLQEGDEYPGPKADHLYRNLGDRFLETTKEAGISGVGHAHSALWWDYNSDGKLDIYVANDFTGNDRLYRNSGDGTFEDVIARASPRAPYYAMGADFGDVNGDGLEDFWVADMAPTSRSRYKQTLESHRHVYEDGDESLPHQYMQNVFLLNLDGESFSDIAALAGLHRTDWTWAARLVDLDNDGFLDAFATNGMLRNFNDGDLGMRLSGQNNLRHYARIFKPTPVLKERNLAFRYQGELSFEAIEEKWGLDKMGVSFGAAFGDLDRDGSLDLVLSNFREPPSVYRNHESKSNRVVVELRGQKSNRFGIGARVEIAADGIRQTKTLIPHRGYMSSDEPLLQFGLGKADQIEEMVIYWPSGYVQTFENLKVNQRFTIKEKGEIAKAVTRVTPRFRLADATFPASARRRDPGSGEFSRQALLPFALERNVSAAVAGDFNGDGKDDFILGGGSGQSSMVLLGGEDLFFEEAWSLDVEEDFPSADAGLALSDFNNDGSQDLIAVSGGGSLDSQDLGYQDRLYTGNGEGEFERDFEVAFSESAVSSSVVALADFDRNGFTDLFIGGGYVPGRFPESVGSALWHNNGKAGFKRVDGETAVGLEETGRVSAAAWADFEKDGFPDLVVLKEWGQVELWNNREGVLMLEEDAFGGLENSGLWTSLAIGDFDGDGRLDVVAGNLGLNSGGLWRPSLGARRLWWKPDEGEVPLIETHLEGDSEWPLVWRDRAKEERSNRRLSALGYAAFSEKTVGELFGDLAQAGFQTLELRRPQSGVFWQQSDGRFDFQPLPAFGQSGRIVGLLAADFDEDGVTDFAASIEPVSLAPWTGRKETGHLALFMGRKDRRLEAELPGESGLSVGPRSPRNLIWGDFDGDDANELIVMFVENEPLVFRLNQLGELSDR